MTEALVRLDVGSQLAEHAAFWDYQAVQTILGSTGVILPLLDPHYEASATTFTTVGDEQATFTYSKDPRTWDTPPSFQGHIPVLEFDGTDEEADTPDAAFWSRDDAGGANGFSMGAWVNVTDTAAARIILAKADQTTGTLVREWFFFVNSSDLLALHAQDESADVVTARDSDAAITMGEWRFLVATYDGAGGASAGDTMTLYDNGAVLASTATNNGSYVGMEDLAVLPTLGFNKGASAPTNFFNGKMAGANLGPFFTTKELSADEVENLYQYGRALLQL